MSREWAGGLKEELMGEGETNPPQAYKKRQNLEYYFFYIYI